MKSRPRRKFFKLLLGGTAVTLLGTNTVKALGKSGSDKSIDGDFKHHVFFWLKHPDNKSEREKFLYNLTDFLNSVDVIVGVHIGEPAGTSREVVDNSYHYDLLVTFKNKEDQDKYQEHDAHKKFVSDTSELWSRVIVYDSLSL